MRGIIRYLYAEDAAQFPKPYVKWSAEPARPEDVPAAMVQAFLIAMQHPRGPTFVSVPSDDWARPATLPAIRNIATEFAPDPAAVVRLAEAVKVARRPVFVVGPEVDRTGCVEQMVALAERARAAVWASPMSSRSSFPERHALFAGFLPAAPVGSRWRIATAPMSSSFSGRRFSRSTSKDNAKCSTMERRSGRSRTIRSRPLLHPSAKV